MQRRRRRERLAGALLAALGVVVLIVAVIAIRQQHGGGARAGSTLPSASRPTTSPRPAPTRTATRPAGRSSSSSPVSPASAKQSLVVLNNTTTAGLARTAAQRFEAGGWTVTKYDNYQNDIISTCAYYDPSVARAQQAALALQRQFPTIKRVEPQFAQLAVYRSPIVVILTPDYSPQ